MADIAELQSAAALLAVTRSILDSADSLDPDAGWHVAERLADILEGALGIAAKGVDSVTAPGPFRVVTEAAADGLRTSLREL
ncbi:hypothetical protein [Streptomyces minutiscleroticus]|uniref:hypothetical protein n=1 Tax=Streptomyces minutiscleroticus TaxID=68238 RepID=UPI00167CE296|nr:hypothetical protein [Streptomyces minutiscleroticus]